MPSSVTREPIPGTLNIVLALISFSLAIFLLVAVSHSSSWISCLLLAIFFSYINNTIFSLLHESVHDIFHPNRFINDWCGRIAAGFVPTAFQFQRIFHLGHHQRNRTEVEQFDYIHPGDNKFLKYAQWYAIVTGLYWVFLPVGCLLYLFYPSLFRLSSLRSLDSKLAQQTSADAMFSGFDSIPSWKIRLEILWSLGIQLSLFFIFDVTCQGWLLCYTFFAVNWSSLQYADHAWSELDIHKGAWNLKVNKVVQFLFLNYHHHRAHHEYPWVPWLYLHQYVNFEEPRPSFFKIYLEMWKGPKPFPAELKQPS